MLKVTALSSLHQQGTGLRELTLEFRSVVQFRLGYNEAALKDLFNYSLDEPIKMSRLLGMEHLSFEGFVEFLTCSGRKLAL